MEKRYRLSAPFIACFVLTGLILLLVVLTYGKIKAFQEGKKRADSTTQVLVAVDPIAYLVERIGGERVSVAVLTPPGKDPETFAPTPQTLASFARSKLFFTVGLPIEERFEKNIQAVAPDAKTTDLRAKLDLLRVQGHSHGESEEKHESHDEELDPHLWTSPANARVMVATITEELARLAPSDAASFEANARKLDEELAALQSEITTRLEPFKGRSFYTFHPAYGYFAREFELTQRAIEVDGKAPRARELDELIRSYKENSARVLIVQPEFDRVSAQTVADEVGASLVEHSPLIKDYFENLRALTEAVERSFK